jgi:hypothetical protein
MEKYAGCIHAVATSKGCLICKQLKRPKSRPSAEEVYTLLVNDGWHVGDGADDCSGHDEQFMRESARKIAEGISAVRATSSDSES